MGLIRTLFLLVIGTIIWFAIRHYFRRQALRREQPQPAAQSRGANRIVKCQHCDLHLPEAEALAYRQQWFCSPAHMERWLEQHRD